VWLTASYFIPTEQEMADLTAAARRGVDVRLLVPGVSDVETTVDIARSNYTELLEAGVKIWETQGVILHSKWMVVDGVWSVIGSSNFDHRSVIFNDEVDAVVLGTETGEAFEWMFEEELPNAKAIELEAWRDRPFGQRLKEHLSRLWQNWL
jgi:cardiolipin synthase